MSPFVASRHANTAQIGVKLGYDDQPGLARMAREFQAFDHDQSLNIEFNEFLAMQSDGVRRKFDDAEIRTWFDQADTDGNGKLDFAEFLAMNGIQRGKPVSQAASDTGGQDFLSQQTALAEKARLFARFDHDNNMTIDINEFLTMQADDVRRKFSDDEIKSWFEQADTDGNGSLDFSEFLALNSLLAVAQKGR